MSNLWKQVSKANSKARVYLWGTALIGLIIVFYFALTSAKFEPQLIETNEIDLSQTETGWIVFEIPEGYLDDLDDQQKKALELVMEMDEKGCNELTDAGIKRYCLTQIQNYKFNDEGKCDLILENPDLRTFCKQKQEKKPEFLDKSEQVNRLYNQNYFDDILVDLENVKEKTEQQVLLAQAITYAQKGSLEFKEKENAEKAIAITKELLILDSKNSNALFLQGYANEIIENYDEAFRLYDLALEIDPYNAAIVSQKAHAYKLIGKSEDAKTFFLKALDFDQKLPHALVNLANIYIGENNAEKAILMYKEALELSQNNRLKSEAAYALSSIYADGKDYITADEYVKMAIAFDPAFDLGYIGLGRLQFLKAFQVNLEDDAKKTLLKESFDNLIYALSLNPKKTLTFYQLGVQYGFLGENTKALEMFAMALDVVDGDITLSVPEKDAMRQEIETFLKQ